MSYRSSLKGDGLDNGLQCIIKRLPQHASRSEHTGNLGEAAKKKARPFPVSLKKADLERNVLEALESVLESMHRYHV